MVEGTGHPLKPSAPLQSSFIDTDARLAQLIRDCERASRIAIDTEADSLHHYYEKVCLIQIATDDTIALIDPLAGLTLDPLLECFAEKPLVLHGADFDLRMLAQAYGFRPRAPIFDTMIAAQLLGYDGLGLAALVDRVHGVKLSKHGQKSNWSRRPLADDLLSYAADDVRYLLSVADSLEEDLREHDRLTWHRENCAALVTATGIERERDEENRWRIKGAGPLESAELRFLRALWHWRDGLASKADRPPFWVATNELLVRLSRWAAAHPRASLDEGPKLPRHITGSRLSALKGAIAEARALPQHAWPARPTRAKHRGEDNRELVGALRDAVATIARELEIPPAVIAPKTALSAIAREKLQTAEAFVAQAGLLNWQATLIEPALSILFQEFPKKQATSRRKRR